MSVEKGALALAINTVMGFPVTHGAQCCRVAEGVITALCKRLNMVDLEEGRAVVSLEYDMLTLWHFAESARSQDSRRDHIRVAGELRCAARSGGGFALCHFGVAKDDLGIEFARELTPRVGGRQLCGSGFDGKQLLVDGVTARK